MIYIYDVYIWYIYMYLNILILLWIWKYIKNKVDCKNWWIFLNDCVILVFIISLIIINVN